METYTDDPEIKAIRMCWQNDLTLSQASSRLKARYGIENNTKLIAEWRKMRQLFGHSSLPLSYLHGCRPRPAQPPTQQELDTPVGNMPGGRTYGDWKGITGPGKRLRELLKSDKS